MSESMYGLPSSSNYGAEAFQNPNLNFAMNPSYHSALPPAYNGGGNTFTPPAYGAGYAEQAPAAAVTSSANTYGQPPAYDGGRGNTFTPPPYGGGYGSPASAAPNTSPAYGNTTPPNPYGQPPAYGGYGEVAGSQPQVASRGSRLKAMFGRGTEAATAGVQAMGQRGQEVYGQLPPEAQAVARGLGRGALDGAMGAIDERYRKEDGKIGKFKVARDIATGNIAGVAKDVGRGGLQGARQGGIDAARQQVAQNPFTQQAIGTAQQAYGAYQQYR